MNPVVAESKPKSNHHMRVKRYLDQIQSSSDAVRTAFEALQKLKPDDIKAAYQLAQDFQKLYSEQVLLDPAQLEDLSKNPISGGLARGWVHVWSMILNKQPIRELYLLPYKQCYACGESFSKSRQRRFCSEGCALDFRKWRDNALNVAASKIGLAKERYLNEQLVNYFLRQKRPRMIPVLEAVWQIACREMQTKYWVIDPEKHTIQYSAQRLKIADWLLRHYCQRRILPDDLPDLQLYGHELQAFSSLNVLLRHTV